MRVVDINTLLPNGQRHRDRKRLSITSKLAAHRWGQDRERHYMHLSPAATEHAIRLLDERSLGTTITQGMAT